MNNIAKFRAKHGLTQEQLAQKMGTSKANVSFYEKSVLTPSQAQKFADALGENVFDILGPDVLKIQPLTDEDKTKLIEMVKSL